MPEVGSKVMQTLHDYGVPNEKSTVTFRGPAITNINFVAETTKMGALTTAVGAMTMGNVIKTERVINEVTSPETQVGMSPFAQRETKWLVRYHDATTGERFVLEIPTADLTLLDPNAKDKMLATATEYTDFKAAFEAFHITPDGGASVLDEIKFVGRNS